MAEPWGLVVPVKLLALAKTRLSAYGATARAELALAFASDVLEAALSCPAVEQVVVVTDDVRAAAALARPGCHVVPDLPGAGLNPALEHGAALLRTSRCARPVAALAADLPALRATDLEAALGAVRERAFVPDAAGQGTTLLAARGGHALNASYGPGSRVRHLGSGAQELEASAGLRQDVDTPQDLLAALGIGVGARTATVVAALALSRPA